MQPSDRQHDDFIDRGLREQTIAENFLFGIWGFAKDSKKDVPFSLVDLLLQVPMRFV